MAFQVARTRASVPVPRVPGHARYSTKPAWLKNINPSSIMQNTHTYTSRAENRFEIITRITLYPKQEFYKGHQIIQKKLEIDSNFRTKVKELTSLAELKLEEAVENSIRSHLNYNGFYSKWVIEGKQPLIGHHIFTSKNGMRFEFNAWVIPDASEVVKEPEKEQEIAKGSDSNEIIMDPDSLEEIQEKQFTTTLSLDSKVPIWLKDHADNSVEVIRQTLKNRTGSNYELSFWVHSKPEEHDKEGRGALQNQINEAGTLLKTSLDELKKTSKVNLANALVRRRKRLCVSAIKAAMLVDGKLPLGFDVHISSKSIFELSACLSKQPENESQEVYSAFKKAVEEDRPLSKKIGGMDYIHYETPAIIGPPRDFPVFRYMLVDKRIEETEQLLIRSENGSSDAEESLQLLSDWERRDRSTRLSDARFYHDMDKMRETIRKSLFNSKKNK